MLFRSLASADVRDLYDENGELLAIHLWPDSIAACVKSIKDGPAGLTVTMHDKLAALRTILEQLGKLKTPGDSMDALADAIRADRKTHGIDE